MVKRSVTPDSQENRLDDADWEQWEEVSSDFGTKLLWGDGANETKSFMGTFLGVKMVPVTSETDEEGNPLDSARAAEFIGSADDEKYYCWLNYALETAIDNGDIAPNDVVRIEYMGEEPTKRGLNPVKKLNIRRKPRR